MRRASFIINSVIVTAGIGVLFITSYISIGSKEDNIDAVIGNTFEFFLTRLIFDIIVALVLIGIQYISNAILIRFFEQESRSFKKMLLGCFLIYLVASVAYITTNIVMVYKSEPTDDTERNN